MAGSGVRVNMQAKLTMTNVCFLNLHVLINFYIIFWLHSCIIVSLDRKTKGFDLQEKLVYQIIEEAGNKGKVIMLPKKIAFKIMNKK